MDNDVDRAWGWLKSIAALTDGAEDHVAELEREACCCHVLADEKKPNSIAARSLLDHFNAAMRFLDAAKACHALLKERAEASGEAKACLENAESRMARGAWLRERGKDVFLKATSVVSDRKPCSHGDFVCQTARL